MKYAGMVEIQGGTFVMGSPEGEGEAREHPQHTVEVDAFSMDKTPVTQREYRALIGVNPSVDRASDLQPVQDVNWFDAVLYCNARSRRDGMEEVYRFTAIHGTPGGPCMGLQDLEIDFTRRGYRLATEAEWEYACRAGSTTRFFWGEQMDGDYAWWTGNSKTMQPVGTKRPNPWGLYDMAGNAQEWCNDWFGEEYYSVSPSRNPEGPDAGETRILRGGSCYPYKDNGGHLRCTNRSNYLPQNPREAFSFRCVVSQL